ncbi:hypothetical protein PENSPDRAFT_671202 [Peniophora sp. CONT]|nr:hypothetical protein PENSPDRAFT_671202 [Peniophora sp. CONT]
MDDIKVLRVLRDHIEFERLWTVDAVGDSRSVVNALQYYQVREASTIAALIERFEPTGTTIADQAVTRVPTIGQYPPRDELLSGCRRVMNGLGILMLSSELQVHYDSMTAMWLVYNLDELRWHAHGHEVWTNCNGDNGSPGWIVWFPHRSAFGPFEARHGEHVAQALKGFDEVVNFHYQRWTRAGGLNGGMGAGVHRLCMEGLANMCLRIMSTFATQQSVSGQTRADFFNELCRATAYQWLELVYAVIHMEMKTDAMDKFEALRIAERVTSPLDGALTQGKYVVSIFGRRPISQIQWFSKPAEVRFALRPPSEIWKTFKASCIWCSKKTDQTCSRCHRVRYCGRDCQRAHWRRSHKTACSIYALTPPALTLVPANDED